MPTEAEIEAAIDAISDGPWGVIRPREAGPMARAALEAAEKVRNEDDLSGLFKHHEACTDPDGLHRVPIDCPRPK